MVSSSSSSSSSKKAIKAAATSKQIKKSNTKKPQSFLQDLYKHVVNVATNTLTVFHSLIYEDPVITTSTSTSTSTDKELKKLQEKVDQLSKELKYLLENKDISSSSSSSSSSSLISKVEATSTTAPIKITNNKLPFSANDLKNITLKQQQSTSSSSSISEVATKASCNQSRPFTAKDLLTVKLKSSLKSPVSVSSRSPNRKSPSSKRRVSFGKDMKSGITSSDIRKVKLKKNNNVATIANPAPSMSMRSALKKALQSKFANVNSMCMEADDTNNENDNENDWN